MSKYKPPAVTKTFNGKRYRRFNVRPYTKAEARTVARRIKAKGECRNARVVAANQFKLWYHVYICSS